MYPVSLALKAKIQLDGSETEKRMAMVLFDDGVQVMSTFELNQLASLTYSDQTCDQIFEVIEVVMSNPMEHSVLSVQKSIVVAQHVLTYGSEKCVNSAWGLTRWVNMLCEFNTVLMAQKQMGVSSWWNSVKGGAVDYGFPVREAAQKLIVLLQDEARVRQLRMDKSDPNSLVPVGNDSVAYVSDDVRLFMLKKRMKEQELVITKSNLAKSHGGFGSGYSAKNGQTVVGAAHSLDEMMARAEREKKRYTDDGPIHVRAPKVNTYQQPTMATTRSIPQPEMDLLDMGVSPSVPAPATVPSAIDLLDFGVSTTPATPIIVDMFSPATAAPTVHDPFGSISAYPPVAQTTVNGTGDLLSMMSMSSTTPAPPSVSAHQSIFDLTPPPTSAVPSAHRSIFDLTPASAAVPFQVENSMVAPVSNLPPVGSAASPSVFDATSENTVAIGPAQPMNAYFSPPVAQSVMASNEDRYAALDALAGPEPKASGSFLTGLEAQNRILSFTNAPVAPATTVAAGMGTNSLGGVMDLANMALTGIFGGTSQGLTVPRFGNDVSTMMAEAPSDILPPDLPIPLPPLAPVHNSYSVSGTLSSYGMTYAMPEEPQLPPDYGNPMGIIAPTIIAPGGGIPGISETYGPPPAAADDDDDGGGFGFAMGGKSGMGLGDPVGPPPGAPPPLPPGL